MRCCFQVNVFSVFVCCRNLKTGQLLRRILLGDGLSHTACLRGYSYCVSLLALHVREMPVVLCHHNCLTLQMISLLCVFVYVWQGVLFVLLQHQLLNSLEEEERKATAKDQMFLEEEKEEERTALFSLVAVNPLSGKSVQATLLYPPKAWSGRWEEDWGVDRSCFCVSAYMHSHLHLSSAGCVKPTWTAPAWWAWVRAAVCVCGSLGASEPRGWCGLLRAMAGSWLDGGRDIRWWLDITTETLPYTATVRARLHSATLKTFQSLLSIKKVFLSLYECLHGDFNTF